MSTISQIAQQKRRVIFVCPIYESYPVVAHSLLMQTVNNWELLLIHDGPSFTGVKGTVERTLKDPRIHYMETEARQGLWGHPIRRWAIEQLSTGKLCPGGTHVVVTNPDNYHMPSYCEKMLVGFRSPRIVATYCASIVHNYIDWEVMHSRVERGAIDTCGFMATIPVAAERGWFSDDHSADWFYMEAIYKKYGQRGLQQVPGCLAVHN